MEVRVIKQKLDEILLIVNNQKMISREVKKELVREVGNRIEEIRVRLEIILKENSEK